MVTDNQASEYIWDRGCAVFVDAVGYSSRIEKAPVATRQQLAQYFDHLKDLISHGPGRIVDTAGDGIFCEFQKPEDAIFCMIGFQAYAQEFNKGLPTNQRMRFRCGITYGDVIREKDVISGPKVNIAARLQQLAEPGTIIIDGDAQLAVAENEAFGFLDMGFRIVKGSSNPVRLWQVGKKSQMHGPSWKALLDDDDQQEDKKARGIAVLPFEVPPGKNLGNEEDAYVALGLASDIADGLAQSTWLKIISPRSSMNYSDAAYTDNRIAHELGVRYLLKGRIRIAGSRMRISAKMIDCPTGHIIWSENYDRSSENLFDIMDEISGLIVGMIEPEYLRHEQRRAASSVPRNVDAWDLVMRARWHFWRGTPSHIQSAQECAEKALVLEPENADIRALLSFCHMTLVWLGKADDPEQRRRDAVNLAREAVQLDDASSNAHFTLGTALSLGGDVRGAIAAERRALEINPNFAGALGELARLLAFDGQASEAREVALKALQLSPTDPHISLWVRSLSLASFVEGDYFEAAKLAADAIAKRPDWFFHYALLAASQALCGNISAAEEAVAEGRRLLPYYSLSALQSGHPFTHDEHFEKFIEGMQLAGWPKR